MKQVFAKFRHYLFFNQEVHVPSSRKEVLKHEHILHYIPRCFNHQILLPFWTWIVTGEAILINSYQSADPCTLIFSATNCWRETWPKKVKNHIHQHPFWEALIIFATRSLKDVGEKQTLYHVHSRSFSMIVIWFAIAWKLIVGYILTKFNSK